VLVAAVTVAVLQPLDPAARGADGVVAHLDGVEPAVFVPGDRHGIDDRRLGRDQLHLQCGVGQPEGGERLLRARRSVGPEQGDQQRGGDRHRESPS
jgi:hypothetical protein